MSESTIGIRRGNQADAKALEPVLAHNVTGLTDQSLPARWLDQSGVFTYLAEDDHRFGLVTVGPVSDFSIEQPCSRVCGEILGWALLPDYQRRGIGRKLLVHGLSVLKRRQCEQALIWIDDRAERARAIVMRLGFESDGTQRIANTRQGVVRCTVFIADLADYF